MVYYWSINNKTLCVELFINDRYNVYDIFKPYGNKYIECLKFYHNRTKNIKFKIII